MPEIIGSDGQLPWLHDELKAGLEGDWDIHGLDATTLVVDWMRDYKMNIRDLSRRTEYWSQTECEMVIAREATTIQRQLFKESRASWAGHLYEYITCVEVGTEYRSNVVSRCEGAMNSLSSFSVDNTSHSDPYYQKILKKDMRRIRTDCYDYGMDASERHFIGLVTLIAGNRELFYPNIASEAEDLMNDFTGQLETVGRIAEGHAKDVGRMVGMAEDDGGLYRDRFEDIMESKINNHALQDDFVEIFLSGFNEMADEGYEL